MTPATLVRDLAAFSVQVALIAVVAVVVLRLVAIPARWRYVCLRVALAASLLGPWALRSADVPAPGPTPATAASPATSFVSPLAAAPVQWLTAAPRAEATAIAAPPIAWPAVALVALVAGIVVRGLWLVVGITRLRRLAAQGTPVDATEYAETQQRLGTRARIAEVPGLPQPVTFGVRRPVVLLPDTLATAPPTLRRAVVTHELFHVRRRDWLSVLGEEAVRTVLWFHPAIFWLTSRIQLAREEVVDELTVRATGDRRTYIEALLAFADTIGVRPAPAFAHRRHLFNRIVSVSKETVMSAPRLMASGAVIVAALVGATWYASARFPILAAAPVDLSTTAPGAVSGQSVRQATEPEATALTPAQAAPRVAAQGSVSTRSAQPAPQAVTPENPIPRRTRGVSPTWPAQFTGDQCQLTVACGYRVSLTALVTLDRDGVVTAVDRHGCSVAAPGASDDAVCRAFFDVSAAAIRQWRYDRPVRAPLQFYASVTFQEGRAEPTIMLSGSDWLAYVRETQDTLRVLAESRRLSDPLTELSNRLRELERAQRLAAERLSPGHPDLLRLQQELAQLSEEVTRVDVALRESATGAAVRPTSTGPFDSPSTQLVAPSGRAAVRPGPSIAFPTPIKQVHPRYTAEAMAAKVTGTVAMEVLVDERGRVADARVIRSIPLLDEAALQAARQWEFTQTLLNGEPVPVLLMLELHFALR